MKKAFDKIKCFLCFAYSVLWSCQQRMCFLENVLISVTRKGLVRDQANKETNNSDKRKFVNGNFNSIERYVHKSF
jgi:hypothetical protein